MSEKRRYGKKDCDYADCSHPHYSLGFCRRHYEWLKKYNISPENLVLFVSCQICGSSEDLVIDHDHRCCDWEGSCGSCVRGVLCRGCNLGLGGFRDDPDRLRAAIEYLRQV